MRKMLRDVGIMKKKETIQENLTVTKGKVRSYLNNALKYPAIIQFFMLSGNECPRTGIEAENYRL